MRDQEPGCTLSLRCSRVFYRLEFVLQEDMDYCRIEGVWKFRMDKIEREIVVGEPVEQE